jgi:hypothetical protein
MASSNAMFSVPFNGWEIRRRQWFGGADFIDVIIIDL